MDLTTVSVELAKARVPPLSSVIVAPAGTEKAFGADKELVVVFVPTHAFAILEALGELFFSPYRSESGLKRTGKKNRTTLVGHAKSLFFAKAEFF